MSIFDHRKKSDYKNKEQASRMSNAFTPLKSQTKNQEEISREFLSTNSETSRMSNAFVSIKSQQISNEDVSNEVTSSKGQTFKHDNGAN